jgi:DNA-directed RNA polymerase specialized sigma24 family protein
MDTMAARRPDRQQGARVTGERDARDALTALYSEHYHSHVRLAGLLLDDVASCEDVVQEAYIRMHHSWHRLDDRDSALAYLRQIVVNLSRSGLRRRLVALRHAPKPMPHGASADRRGRLRRGRARRSRTCAPDPSEAPARGGRPGATTAT